MVGSRARVLFVCVLACGTLLCGRAVLAQSITFRRVVDTNTPIPGGTGNFTVLAQQPSVRGGNVAFRAEGANGQVGIYTEIGGVLNLVADTSSGIPGGTGTFVTFGTPFAGSVAGSVSFDGVSVVFQAIGPSNQEGVYTDEGGTLRVVADINTPIPGGAGNFAGFRFDPSIDAGNIGFAGGATPGPSATGIYTEIGGVLSVVADGSTPVPGGTGTFSGLDIVSIDGTDVAFRAFSPGSIELVTHIAGVFAIVMDLNTPIPGDPGTFNLFGAAALDGGNVVVKGGQNGDMKGVYTDLGGSLRVVANKHTPVPRGTGNFNDFFSSGPLAAIDNGNLVFTAGSSVNFLGIYAEMLGSLMKVVDVTDTLGGATPNSLGRGLEALGGTDVAFWASFADGSQAIFVATIPLNVCGNGILEAGEECDDQGQSPTCNADCTFTECGNGVVNAGEACDNGPDNSDTLPDACRTNCTLATCGDGVLDSGEVCDDGNTISGDGCRSDCQPAACGDGILDPGEACDAGTSNSNTTPNACRTNCARAACGDSVVDFGEQCDDGNLVSGDGCSSICERENAGQAVPTVSQWGLVVMTLLLAVGGKVYFRRRVAFR